MPDPGLSDAGLEVPRLSDYLDTIRADFVASTGLDVDWDSDLVLGQLTAIMAQLLDQQAEILQAVYDSFDVNAATGVQLSNIAQLVGVLRKQATHAQATVTLEGDPGTIITVGKMVEGGGSDGRARWELIEDVTIPGSGSVATIVRAVVAGRTVALPGEIDAIVTPVPGWDSVTNAEAASSGTDAETDAELRARRSQSIQRSAGLGIGALRAKVLALSFIENCGVIDNPDNEANTVEGVPLPASSLLVVVTPDTLTTDQQTELHRLIYDNAPVGIAIAGDETATVEGSDGFDKPTAFSYAEDVEAHIEISPVLAPGYSGADARAALTVLVQDHIATLTIGDALRRLKIAALADQVPGIIGLGTLLINSSTEDLEATAVQRIVYGSLEPA